MQRALGWMLLGGLCAGTLDILFATGFWALRGVAPQRILQSVAAGVLGKASFGGGAASAALGLGLHYLIAIAMASAYRDGGARRHRHCCCVHGATARCTDWRCTR